jgi:hypothetical protein
MRMVRVPIVAAGVIFFAARLYAANAEPIAIVYGLTGQASVKTPSAAAKRPAQRFEWLPAGAEIEVASGASVLLAFASGARYELGGGSRATLSAPGGFGASSGPVRALPSVPPFPRIESLAAEARPGARAGALRLRGLRIRGLYPCDDASVLPNETVLSFEALPGTPRYKVQVEDETGNTVLDVEVATSSVVVSPGVLKPGARYHWTVRSLGGSASARGEADFNVLTAEGLAARDELRRSLEGPADAEGLALLAEVDSRLGLLFEARREFSAALAKAPGDLSLKAAVEKLNRQISDPGRDRQP